jgi:hypothetical protein
MKREDMTKSYESMTFAEKALFHVTEAERYQKKAEELEEAAGLRGSDDPQLAAYLLMKDDNFAFPYRQATGNRNGHQQRAIMYGILALVVNQLPRGDPPKVGRSWIP